jgi:hypothetical protein
MYRIVLCVVLLLAVARAQERPSKRLYVASLIAFNAANVLDVTSSYGKRELNPALSGSNGTFGIGSLGVKAGLVGAVDLFEALWVRRHPERMRTTGLANFNMGAIAGGMAIHNYDVRSAPP